jgi:hypothetical protein
MTAWYQRCCHRGKAIVQGLIGHTGIAPKAFFNAIGQKRRFALQKIGDPFRHWAAVKSVAEVQLVVCYPAP